MFAKLGNGTVRDLTLDTNTVYTHPSSKQCSWEPSGLPWKLALSKNQTYNFSFFGDNLMISESEVSNIISLSPIMMCVAASFIITDTSGSDNEIDIDPLCNVQLAPNETRQISENKAFGIRGNNIRSNNLSFFMPTGSSGQSNDSLNPELYTKVSGNVSIQASIRIYVISAP